MTIENPIDCPCIKVQQPIGSFYIALLSHRDLIEITYVDVRRIEKEEREIETVLGIQRPLSPRRVREIGDYVNTMDANFPTSVILAISSFDENQESDETEIPNIFFNKSTSRLNIRRAKNVAKVLDGQHRIEGLNHLEPKNEPFQVPVTIFVDADIEQQAMIFATVNKTQVKVNKSLVYDLFELAKNRSPEKTCHNIAIVLDRREGSPFQHKIKILGTADDSARETLTQATFVEALLKYITSEPMRDRDFLKRNPGKKLPDILPRDKEQFFLFDWFRNEEDGKIAKLLLNYFSAVQQRWKIAWDAHVDSGYVLNRTTGFLALMKFLKDACKHLGIENEIPDSAKFKTLFDKVTLKDEDFNKQKFLPGTTGQRSLYLSLLNETGLRAK